MLREQFKIHATEKWLSINSITQWALRNAINLVIAASGVEYKYLFALIYRNDEFLTA